MAGYVIYSLDWDKFQQFVADPSPKQLQSFAKKAAAFLISNKSRIEKNDPLRDWPRETDSLAKLVESRLKLPEWYGDLSHQGKALWDSTLTHFCNVSQPKTVDFQVENDGIYWDVIDLVIEYYQDSPTGITDKILSHFGTRPFRYLPPVDHTPAPGDWIPNHSMHTPVEVQALLKELQEAEPAIAEMADKAVLRSYREDLIPAVENVAEEGRLLYIGVDN